jgi:hypothetical protein
MLRLYLYARVRVLSAQIAHETAGAACTRSSLRPLTFEGGKRRKPRTPFAPRECERAPSPLVDNLIAQFRRVLPTLVQREGVARVSVAIPGIVATTRMSLRSCGLRSGRPGSRPPPARTIGQRNESI